MKKLYIAIAVVVVAILAFYGYTLIPKYIQQSSIDSQTKTDNVALANLLKENNLQAAVIQTVNVFNKSTISLMKPDGTVQALTSWTDSGNPGCISLLSDCGERPPIRSKFTQGGLPVDVSLSSNKSLVYFLNEAANNSKPTPPIDLTKYIKIDANEIPNDRIDHFSPNGKFVFSDVRAEVSSGTFQDDGIVFKVNDISQFVYGAYSENGLTRAIIMPKILILDAAWTPDSQYLLYQYQNQTGDNIDRNATSAINLYNAIKNTQTTLLDSYALEGNMVAALSSDAFLEARTDGLYMVQIQDGTSSASKVLSQETKLVGVIP